MATGKVPWETLEQWTTEQPQEASDPSHHEQTEQKGDAATMQVHAPVAQQAVWRQRGKKMNELQEGDFCDLRRSHPPVDPNTHAQDL